MAVTVPSISSPVQYFQGSTAAPPAGGFTGAAPVTPVGGSRIVPGLVLSTGGSGGLVVSLFVHTPENTTAVFSGVPHASTAAAGAPYWQWSAQSGGSNS